MMVLKMINLWAVCASHIDEEKRLYYLNLMLESYKNQTVIIPMCISISGSENISSKIDDLINKWPDIIFLRQNEKLYQFEHYTKIVDYLNKIHGNVHLLFTDDDDIWNNIRVETYLKYNDDIFKIENSILRGSSIENSQLSKSDEYIQICMTINKFYEICKHIERHLQNIKTLSFDMRFNIIAMYEITQYKIPPNYKTDTWLYFYRFSFDINQVSQRSNYTKITNDICS